MAESVVWEEQARRGRNHAVLLVDMLAESFKKKLVSKSFGIPFDPTAFRQLDGARHFAAKELQAWVDALQEKESREEGFLLEAYLDYEKTLDAFRAHADALASEDWSRAGNGALSRALESWADAYEAANGYAYGYTILNRFYPDGINAAVAAREPDAVKQNVFLKVLFNSDKFSDTRFEQESLLGIAIAAKQSESGFEDPRVKKMLAEHTEKFRHLGIYYFYRKPFSEKDFEGRAKHMLDEGLEKKIGELEFQKNVAQESGRMMDSLGFSESERLKVKTFKQVAFTVNYYDESVSYCVCKCLPLFNEIAARLGISYAQLVELRVEEITQALSQGFVSDSLKKEALKRYEDSALVFENGGTRVLVGGELQKYYSQQKPREESYSHLAEFKGQPASPGMARGPVKILSSAMELAKVLKGDVLVAAATVPAFVPAMERAVAIVTDEGGLLSHAAIVSRELGVPCVVGTKIATKALKDGDIVEVDATRGTVRKTSGSNVVA